MLTACQIGLSCCSQLFLFLSEPEFRPRLLSATAARGRDEILLCLKYYEGLSVVDKS